MVRYAVKADRAGENVAAIERVFAALEREAPPGLRYAAFRLAAGDQFVHLVSHEGPGARNVLPALPEFRAFLAGMEDRRAARPEATPVDLIGAYRLFGD
jgi:hypothetical protein